MNYLYRTERLPPRLRREPLLIIARRRRLPPVFNFCFFVSYLYEKMQQREGYTENMRGADHRTDLLFCGDGHMGRPYDGGMG